jgi:hypothetical protein
MVYYPAAVSVGLIVAYVLTLGCHTHISKYRKDLSESQKATYQSIVSARAWCFISGILVALLLLGVYLTYMKHTDKYRTAWNSALILLLTPLIVYLLLPKSKFMLLEASTAQETKDWFNVYLCMSRSMIYGFVVGFLLWIAVSSLTVNR